MTTTETITIPRYATLPALLALLVEHGAEALLSAEGIGACAEALLLGPLTIADHARASYGDAATWAAWEALRADHADRLTAMVDARKAQVRAANERACAAAQIHGQGSTGGDWLADSGR